MSGAQKAALPSLLGGCRGGDQVGDKAEASSRRPEAPVQKRKPRPAITPLEDLPEELPTNDFVVRNTFIDTPVLLSPSLQGFYHQREVQTCPSRHAGRLLQGGLFQDVQPPPQVLSTVPYHVCPLPQLGALPSAGAPLQAPPSPPVHPPRHAGLPQPSQSTPPLRAPSAATYNTPPPAPDLMATASGAVKASVPPLPQTGALPSAGSALHASRQCRPCGFFHGKGCDNGTSCSFCHLCPPGEKRRRQKEKFAGAPRPTSQKSQLPEQKM